MAPNMGFVFAGYALTGVALGGYVARLVFRARRARQRAAAIAVQRSGSAS